MFGRYLKAEIPSNPWSEEPLLDETKAVLDDLLTLNTEKHWWTVGSQPAVDGAPSSDKTYGFGPPGGHVYQKAFVEFFAPRRDVEELIERMGPTAASGITYYASNRAGEFRTNMAQGDANAVTWGVFVGKEIVTTTLIEEMSFKAWKDEAFGVWNEWEHLYPSQSASRDLIRRVGDEIWLVSIVHHDYKAPRGLWDFLGVKGRGDPDLGGER
jgi:methylenetetrahydrofolate reductase (NADPH)